MRAFLARCAAVGLIVGGFALTGDAGRLLARSRGVIEATTIPQATDSAAPLPSGGTPTDGRSAVAAAAPASEPGSSATAPASSERSGSAIDHAADAPLGSAPSRIVPDRSARSSLGIASLAPGDRILVWLGRGSPRATAPLAYDVVDPATGDAIEVGHAAGDDRLAAHAPRRRVRLEGSTRRSTFTRSESAIDAGRIEVDRWLRLSAVGSHAAPSETIGPVVAIQVVPTSGSP